MTIRVAFVDEQPISLASLLELYSTRDDVSVVGSGQSAMDALELAEDVRPDILVADLAAPSVLLGTVEAITTNFPATRVVVFTAAASVETAVRILSLGHFGYVLKGSKVSELHQAITRVHRGFKFITPGLSTKVALSMKAADSRRNARRLTKISSREEQIICLLSGGCTNRQIAAGLGLTESTVRSCLSILMQKFAVRSRLEVVLTAQRLNIAQGAGGTRNDLWEYEWLRDGGE